ncbi:glutamate-gated chloride channel isoform X3 [Microplitis mediator]|uniref:glutamate-gated chloride channel isoform X3 n=1 Tax=Microplitis mediator TaxID=375433 RepID=UPI002556588D|nr:glutamate-gated chloride channel isoform X3 [Microplitis mediator]
MKFLKAAAMWPGVLPLVVLLIFLVHPSRCSPGKVNYREKEKEVLDDILGEKKYDARIRPSGENGTDGPAYVQVNIFVRSISKIDDVTMEYSVQLTFREQWLDERLKFNDFGGRLKYLTLTESTRVWMPDLFFSNEKEGHFHEIIMPNVYIRIFPHGSVLYSIRISLTLSCPMNLKLYPLDRQTCSLRMASYGWTTDDLVFVWKEGDPVQVVKNLHLPRFTLEKYLTDYCNSKTNTGEYSCLKVDLLFKREFSYYLIQIYIPCCMLVIVSWVSFWLDQSAVPARVSLGVTTLLTMATQTSGINASLPPVSYTKAIDVWTGVCLTFVFGALLEFALVNYASRSDMHRENIKKKYRTEIEHSSSVDPTTELLEPDSSTNFQMVVAVQVPDEIQAHRRHLTDHFPPRVRSVQPRVLVHVPVSGGSGERMNGNNITTTTPPSTNEETFGTRDVARGHLYHHSHSSRHHHHSRSRSHSRNTITSNHSHHVYPHINNNHQHHHQTYSRQRQHRHRHQQPPQSPTSSTQTEEGETTHGSPGVLSINSRRPPSSRGSSSPASSRMETPSPSTSMLTTAGTKTNLNSSAGNSSSKLFRRLSRLNRESCTNYFRDLSTCHTQGSARIDVISRFAFPFMFVVFNFAYWSMYLFREEDTTKMN